MANQTEHNRQSEKQSERKSGTQSGSQTGAYSTNDQQDRDNHRDKGFEASPTGEDQQSKKGSGNFGRDTGLPENEDNQPNKEQTKKDSSRMANESGKSDHRSGAY